MKVKIMGHANTNELEKEINKWMDAKENIFIQHITHTETCDWTTISIWYSEMYKTNNETKPYEPPNYARPYEPMPERKVIYERD